MIAPGDMYGQIKACLEITLRALAKPGASAEDMVRTRMFLTDISRWVEAGRAHAEVFGNIKPASTMVEVSKFLKSEYLIEIEATAVGHQADPLDSLRTPRRPSGDSPGTTSRHSVRELRLK